MVEGKSKLRHTSKYNLDINQLHLKHINETNDLFDEALHPTMLHAYCVTLVTPRPYQFILEFRMFFFLSYCFSLYFLFLLTFSFFFLILSISQISHCIFWYFLFFYFLIVLYSFLISFLLFQLYSLIFSSFSIISNYF